MQNECDMLLASFDREVNDFAKRVGKDRAPASYRTLVTVNKHLHAFVGRFYQSKDVPMQDLTGTFFRDFCLYLQFDCRLAHWNSAVHASSSLFPPFFIIQNWMKFLEVLYSFQWWNIPIFNTFII